MRLIYTFLIAFVLTVAACTGGTSNTANTAVTDSTVVADTLIIVTDSVSVEE